MYISNNFTGVGNALNGPVTHGHYGGGNRYHDDGSHPERHSECQWLFHYSIFRVWPGYQLRQHLARGPEPGNRQHRHGGYCDPG